MRHKEKHEERGQALFPLALQENQHNTSHAHNVVNTTTKKSHFSVGKITFVRFSFDKKRNIASSH